jgi:hypothetical protein
LRVERQPDNIAGLRYKGGPHQDSSPRGGPQSVSR